MNEFLDPAHNFTPRQNPAKRIEAQAVNTGVDFARLESLTKPELIALIRRLPEAATAHMTQEEIADAMMIKLAYTALTSKDTKDTLAAIREWLDRVKGKPQQSVTLTEKKQINLVIECGIPIKATPETIDCVPVRSD